MYTRIIILLTRSGHIPSKQFAHLMKKATSLNCDDCGVIEDVQHFLTECVRPSAGERANLDINLRDVGIYNTVLAFPLSNSARELYKMIEHGLKNN